MISSGVRTAAATSYLTCLFASLLGLGAIAWGLFTLPLFWQEASPRSIATKLVEGESFKLQSLVAQAQDAERITTRYRFCNPAGLDSLFILRLFILNESIAAADQALVDSSYNALYQGTREVLGCTPTDSLGWLTLFWLDAGRRGVNERNVGYLRLSYAFGRNEGWIAFWRVRLAFILFERLPADLSSDAVEDFVKLVNTGQFYWQTADIFEHASPVIQNRVVDQLKSASVTSRRQFARELHERGIDVDIPGIERPAARPWR